MQKSDGGGGGGGGGVEASQHLYECNTTGFEGLSQAWEDRAQESGGSGRSRHRTSGASHEGMKE